MPLRSSPDAQLRARARLRRARTRPAPLGRRASPRYPHRPRAADGRRALRGHDVDRHRVRLRRAAAAPGRRRGSRRRRAKRSSRPSATPSPSSSESSSYARCHGAGAPGERELRRVIGDGRRRGRRSRRERPARALPRARPPAHLRRALGRLPPPGPDRHVRDLLEPRGDAGRRGRTRSSDDDWIFPSYRESAIGLLRGMPARHGAVVVARPSRPAGGTRPTTTSRRSASRSRRTCRTRPGSRGGRSCAASRRVAIAFFGDGATSEGAFHEGANFAARDAGAARPLLQQQPVGDLDAARGADRAPRRSPTRRSATGCPATRVDGADVLAVFEATREAVARARAGDGPTFIEAVTYRSAPHATADDPTRLHRPGARRGGAPRTSASAASRATCGGSGCSRRAARADPRRGGAGCMRDGDRRGRGRARRPTRRSLFAHALRRRRRARSTPTWPSCGGSWRWLS